MGQVQKLMGEEQVLELGQVQVQVLRWEPLLHYLC